MRSRRYGALLRSLAANIRAGRLRLRLTQELLAEAAGLELRYLQKLEAAAQGMSLEALVRLADALDTTPDRLLVRRNVPPRNARRGRPPKTKRPRAR